MGNKRSYSPLRYPGGKACLANFIAEIAVLNNSVGGTYLELYAGGAGAALNLLFDNVFQSIHINDFDYNIYCFWDSILNDTESFIQKIHDTDVTIKEWHNQQVIFRQGRNVTPLDLGFATFFLNRTNRSGIIFKAGPIGGLNQEGNYKLDVRFNKGNLIQRINKISEYRDRIILTNLDAITILTNLQDYHANVNQLFVYLDPPYYKKGKQLYMNNYGHENHQNLSDCITEHLQGIKWLISYDNVSEITALYNHFRMSSFDLNYTLQSKKFGSELLVFSNNLILPEEIKVNSRSNQLLLI